jgi:hypothetical protein
VSVLADLASSDHGPRFAYRVMPRFAVRCSRAWSRAQSRWARWPACAWTWEYDPNYVVVGLFLFPPWWPGAQLLINSFVIVYAIVLIGATIVLGRRRGGLEVADEVHAAA